MNETALRRKRIWISPAPPVEGAYTRGLRYTCTIMKNILVKTGKRAIGALLVLSLFAGFAGSAKAFSLDDFVAVVKAIKADSGTLTPNQATALSALYSTSVSRTATSTSSTAAVSATPFTTTTTAVAPTTLTTDSSAATATQSPVTASPVTATPAPSLYSAWPTSVTNSPVTPSSVEQTPSVPSSYGNVSSASSAPVATANAVAITQVSYGATGGSVLALQNVLAARGYLSATPNGKFGPATFAAVKAFQAANGLEAVGSVGPKTARLLSDTAINTSTMTRDTGTSTTSSSSFLVAANTAYGDQTVAVGTTHYKIGSYTVKNQNASESAKVTSLLFGFTTGGTASVSELHNIAAYNGGAQIGTTASTIGSASTVSIPVSVTLAPLASTIVDVYGDVGTAPAGSGWRTNLLAFGNGLTSGTPYTSGSSMSAQSIEIGAGCSATSAPSIHVIAPNGGETYSVGDTMHITWTSCNIGSGPVQIQLFDSRYSSETDTGDYIVVNTMANTGSYDWVIPAVAGPFSGGHLGGTAVYTINLSSWAFPFWDHSDSAFSISASSGGLIVAKNAAYPDHTIPPGTIGAKIGSYTVTNTSSTAFTITNLKFGLNSMTSTVPASDFTNLTATETGTQVGPTLASASPVNNFPVSVVLPPGFSKIIFLNADLGSVSPFTFYTTLQVTATSTPTGSITVAPVTGQTMTVAGAAPCTINTFIASPSTISPGMTSTLTWNTTGCTFSSPVIAPGPTGGTALALSSASGTVMTNPIYSTTSYTLTAWGAGGLGVSATATISVSSACTPGSAPSVTLVSPNGGESYGSTSTVHATWTSCNQPTGNLGIALVDQTTGYSVFGISPASPLAFSVGHYDFPVPNATLASGMYKLRIWCSVPGSEAYCIDSAHSEDLSNGSFTITTSPLAPSSVSTQATVPVTSTSAQVTGTGTSNMSANQGWFNYGTTASLGSETAHTSFSTYGTMSTTMTLTGLMPHTTYYYRYAMSNGAGTTYGSTVSFTTLP